ncbi:MAG: FHA domain-containing protein [Anaerolineaceae bacterium]|nr:FHA domain-containing protein [Anaerolineaceae bacterium]
MDNRLETDLPVLIAQAGPLNGERWLLQNVLIIGRDAACEIVVPDRQVSRFHARISTQKDGLLLEDLSSKNGTYCNGAVVAEPVYLNDGDLLQVALVQNFVYLSSDATMPMEEGRASHLGIRTGKLYLDGRSRRVWIGNTEVLPPLSVQQFRLLKALYDQEGKVVSRQDLVEATWGSEEARGVSEQAFDALVRRLRDRLGQIDKGNPYIITVRGHGLRLENPAET